MNPNSIEQTKKYFNEAIYLAITEYNISYFEIMKMPIGFFIDLLEWKNELEKKKVEEIQNELNKD